MVGSVLDQRLFHDIDFGGGNAQPWVSSKMVYSPSSAGFDMFWSWKIKVSIPRRAVPFEPIPFSISIEGKDVVFGNLTAPLQKVIMYYGLFLLAIFFSDKIDTRICQRPLEMLSSQEFHPFFPPLRMAFGKVPLHGQCQGIAVCMVLALKVQTFQTP